MFGISKSFYIYNGVKQLYRTPLSKQIRLISTSKKNRDTTTINPTTASSEAKTDSIFNGEKNWVSFGFDENNKQADEDAMHTTAFLGITVIFVIGGFLLAYRPDFLLRDWAQREGYLELRRRERLGLPRVDANYLAIEQIKLPSDEELGDIEIVI